MAKTIAVKNQAGEIGDIPAEQLQEALKNGFTQVAPEELAKLDEAKLYGDGFVNEAKAFGAGAARGLSFGISDQAMTKSGLVEPETLRKLEEHNPTASGAGEIAGVVAPAIISAGSSLLPSAAGTAARASAPMLAAGVEGAVTAGARAMLPQATTAAGRVIQGAATKGLGSAVEGAMYGAGQLVSDEALGDPDLNAEKIMSELGYGAVMGGAVGGIFSGVGKGIDEFRSRPKTLNQKLSQKATEAVDEVAEESLGMPTSYDDLAKRVADSGVVNPAELPSKAILEDAAARLSDMKIPPHRIQIESLDNPQVRDIYKTVRESQTELGKVLQEAEAIQKRDLKAGLDSTLTTISKDVQKDAFKGGEEIADAFYAANQAEKKAAGAAFEKLKEVAPNLKVTRPEALTTITSAIPEANGVFKIAGEAGDEVISIKPYSPKMPVSKSVYTGIKDLYQAAASAEGMSVQELRNLRDNLSTLVKFDSSGIEKAQVGRLRKATMDLIESKVQEVVPDMEVRETFKRYAQNEGRREMLEKVFGGSFDDRASLLKQIKPENLSDNVFRNSGTIQVAKEVLPPEIFDKLVASHIAQKVEQFTDLGKFSSQKFATWLKSNSTELGIAFADKPQVLQRMQDLADVMRILPDAPSINPSGTAKTADILQRVNIITRAMGKMGNALKNPLDSLGDVLVSSAEATATRADIKALEEIMAGKNATEALKKGGYMAAVERQVNRATQRMESLVTRALGQSDTMAHWVTGSLVNMSHERKLSEFDKIEKRIDEASATPETYLDAVEKPTKDLYPVAPNISAAMQQSLTRTTQYLKSKMPNTQPAGPLAKKPVPSDAELSRFFRHYEVVENPYIVLKQLKFGTLTPESMETMSAVYPKLLGEMQAMVFDKVADKKAKKKSIPYQTQILLSAFLNQDLSGEMKDIGKTQAAWSAPSQQEDGLQAPVKPTQSGMQSITLAGRSQTGLERVTTRS